MQICSKRPPDGGGSALSTLILLLAKASDTNDLLCCSYRIDTTARLTFAAPKSFSLDTLHLHDHAVLNDDRYLSELESRQGLPNVLDRRIELPGVARGGSQRIRCRTL
jgi:hypothetical protein